MQRWEVVVGRAPPLHPRGSSPPCSQCSHRPSLPGALLFSPMGSPCSGRSGSTDAAPARLYKAPAGPFGKRISFFLDAFPDLGVMEGLSAARARPGQAPGGGAGQLGPPASRPFWSLGPRALWVKPETSA